MPVLELRFPAGRYHATPWGRHVNEGIPEWPPSPFRLARALVDVRHRRRSDVSLEALTAALALLAGKPRFALPPSVQAAVKVYVPQNDGVERQPVLDAFVGLDATTPLYMELPDATEDALRALERLAEGLDYLGRSQSWVTARLCEALPADREWNCLPRASSSDADAEITVNLLCSRAEYDRLLMYRRRETGEGKKKEKQGLNWLEALALSTKYLFAEGWNRHPLLAPFTYTMRQESRETVMTPPTLGCVTYALHGVPLLPLTQALPFARRVRAILMGIHKRIMGGDAGSVSSMFSGKDSQGMPLRGHAHACYWPLDLDGDGCIDHLRIHGAQKFTAEEQQALYELRKVWTPGRGDDLTLTLEHALARPPVSAARCFVSHTPLVLQRHWRKGRGEYADWLEKEVRRACAQQNLPAPCAVTPIEGMHGRRWSNFTRACDGQTAPSGYGFRLEFLQPVEGPFALGALAHFGLGVFTPCEDTTEFARPESIMDMEKSYT